MTTHPILLRVTRVPVGRRASGFVQVTPPSDDRIAVEARGDIWIYRFANGALTPLTFGDPPDRFPLWSDERQEQIEFDSTPRAELEASFWTASDGRGKA